MPAATLSITLEDDGTVSVNGPLDNPLLFHGMIGVASYTLRQYQDEKTKARATRVTLAPGPLPTIGGR
jgi:hypothetical protein